MSLNEIPSKFMSRFNRKRAAKLKCEALCEPSPVLSARGFSFCCGSAGARLNLYKTVKPYSMAGFNCAVRPKGEHDPMTVNALWLGVQSAGILWLTIDCVGLCGAQVDEIRGRLSEFVKRTNCPTVNVSCSHSHAGVDTCGYWGALPITGKNRLFMRQLVDACVAVAEMAYKNRKNGNLFRGDAHTDSDCIYRKRPPQTVRDIVTRLRFVPDDGSRETWLVNFGAHVSTLESTNRLISSDFVYYLREKVKPQAHLMFTAGAVGSVDGGLREMDDRFKRAKTVGEKLADYVVGIENDELLEPEIKLVRRQIVMPDDNDVLTFLGLLGVMSSKTCRCSYSKTGFGILTEMTYIRIGKQAILCLPGEIFPELVYGGYLPADKSATGLGGSVNPRPLADIACDDRLIICGVTNDMTGYAVPPNDFILHPTQPCLDAAKDQFGLNHYHETNSLGIMTAQVIADTFTALLDCMNAISK